MQTEKRYKLILIDECPLVRIGFEAALAKEGFDTVASTDTPDEILSLCHQFSPDAVVTELSFAGKGPQIGVIERVIEADKAVNIVVLTSATRDINIVKDAYRAGARAVLNKTATPSFIAAAVQRTLSGERFFPPDIAQRFALMTTGSATSPIDSLDERERIIFIRMAVGKTLEEIAEELSLGLRTVSQVSTTIKTKLGVSRPAEITILAIQHRLINIEQLECI